MQEEPAAATPEGKEPVKDHGVASRGNAEHSKAKAALDGDTANVLPLE